MNSKHWSAYWKAGHNTTFGDFFQDNYEKSIKSFWLNEFSLLASGSTVHDLAAGSCAIAKLALDFSNENNLKLVLSANDYAEFTPEYLTQFKQQYPQIQFYSETNSESLGLENQSIDLVVSQYGFEYSDYQKTCDEVLRVLRPKGKLIAVMHSHASEVIKESQQMLTFLNYLLNESGYIELLYKFSHEVGDVFSKNDLSKLKYKPQLEILRKELNESINAMMTNYSDEFIASENLAHTERLLKELLIATEKDRVSYCDYIKSQSTQYQKRLQDMVDASLSKKDVQHFKNILSGYGNVEISELLDHQNKNIGLVLKFDKNLNAGVL